MLSVSTTLGLVPPRNALHFPSLSPLTTSRSYTRSLQPHSDASASTEAPTASNSKDPFASELRALMGSGDLDAALALLGSKRDGEFDYNDETMAAVTDLLASGAGLRLFSDLMIEFNWYSVQNGMPRHYLEALVKDLMAHGRMMEASEILNRRAMKVHRSLRDPNLTKIVIPTDVELYERFAEYQTDEIDVKWLLSSRFECALRNGETRIMLACSLPLAIRFPASMEYQVLYARSAHLCFRPSQQTQYGFDFDAGAFLLHMDPLPQLPSENIILRQYKMEAMIAIGKFDDAIAEFEMTSSPSTSHLVPWHIHATLAKEDKLKESTSEVLAHYKRAVASEAWNTVSTLERLQWARLLKASGSPSEALEIVEFLVNQGSSRHEFDDMLLFMFIMTDLPPLNARAVDLLESAARRSKAPALMHTVAHFYMAHPDMTERTTRLLDTALHYAPENILTRHLRAVIAEREERLEDALKINAIIYDEEPSILVASRVLRLHRKMGDFKKFMHFFNYLSDVKKRYVMIRPHESVNGVHGGLPFESFDPWRLTSSNFTNLLLRF